MVIYILYNTKRRIYFDQLKEKLNKYKSIALYGIGNHTKILLEAIDFNQCNVNIFGLIDREIFESERYGYKIFQLDDVIGKVDAIIISSDLYQEQIYKRIEHIKKYKIEIIQIYPYEDLLSLDKGDESIANISRTYYQYKSNADIIAVGFTFRTIDNYLPVLDKFTEEDYNVNLAIFPNLEDSNHKKIYKIKYPIIIERPIQFLNSRKALPFEELCNIVEKICKEVQPKIFIIDDILNYPSNAIKKAIDILCISNKPKVICFQHGFHQLWDRYNINFACDYFFCFGKKHKLKFIEAHQQRVFVTGLPKIDRLKSYRISDEKYILFASQDDWSMRPYNSNQYQENIYKLLAEISEAVGLPLKIKPHPQYSSINYPTTGIYELLDPQSDGVAAAASATYVITTGSTIALESLIMDKPTVILPSNSALAYTECPMLAETYTVNNIIDTLYDYQNRKKLIDNYLDDVIDNWRKFDSANKSFDLIKKIIRF